MLYQNRLGPWCYRVRGPTSFASSVGPGRRLGMRNLRLTGELTPRLTKSLRHSLLHNDRTQLDRLDILYIPVDQQETVTYNRSNARTGRKLERAAQLTVYAKREQSSLLLARNQELLDPEIPARIAIHLSQYRHPLVHCHFAYGRNHLAGDRNSPAGLCRQELAKMHLRNGFTHRISADDCLHSPIGVQQLNVETGVLGNRDTAAASLCE